MEETFEQKVIRNVQGNFAVYKTSEVVGSKSMTPNLEWMESDEVDKFFAFARNLGAKVIYISEAEEEDEQGNTITSIVQVGFLHQSIMHHINLIEEEDESEEEQEEEEYEEEEEPQMQPQSPQQFQQQVPQQPQNQFGQPSQPQQPPQNNQFIGNNF